MLIYYLSMFCEPDMVISNHPEIVNSHTFLVPATKVSQRAYIVFMCDWIMKLLYKILTKRLRKLLDNNSLFNCEHKSKHIFKIKLITANPYSSLLFNILNKECTYGVI